MKREPVESSVVASIGYDAKHRILEIEFHYNNAVYQYEDVPQRVYMEFMESDSKGKYFNQQIRKDYPEVKIR